LAGFKQGQVLDQDPITGETDTVSAVGSGTVTVTTSVPGIQGNCTYDASSGVLTELVLVTAADGGTLDVRLQGNS
jgi:Tfp pilus tip-associated adhesin PilY1